MEQKTFFSFILLTLLSTFCYAQSSQKGIVLEYQGPDKKTPLANVEIVVNNAGSTVSDKNGEFTLQFRTLNAGDKITIRRVEKCGYELFNTDIVSQFVITNDEPITIVMCKTDKLHNLRNTYTSNAHKRLEESYSAESSSLEESFQNGFITEIEFEKKKKDLQNRYDEMLENIDNYIERFTRLDLSELNDLDKTVIEHVRNGNILDAIKVYDSANLMNSYLSQSKELQKLTAAEQKVSSVVDSRQQRISSLKSSIRNQINVLWLAGGSENFKKILNLTKDMADANPYDREAQIEYGDLCYNSHRFDEALEYYNKAFDASNNDVLKEAQVRIKRGAVYSKMNDIDNGTWESITGLHDIDSLLGVKQDSDIYLIERVFSQVNIANNFLRKKDLVNAKAYYSWALSEMQLLMELDSIRYIRPYGEVLSDYGHALALSGDSIEAEQKLLSAIDVFGRLFQESPKSYSGSLAKTYDYLAEMYLDERKSEIAEKNFWTALSYYQQACEYNSEFYLGLAGVCLQKLGRLHISEKRYERAMTVFNRSIDLLSMASEHNPYEYKDRIASANLAKGTVYWLTGDYENTLKQDLLAENLYAEIIDRTSQLYNSNIGQCAVYSGDCYFKLGDYGNALKCYERAYNYDKKDSYLYKMKRMQNFIVLFGN